MGLDVSEEGALAAFSLSLSPGAGWGAGGSRDGMPLRASTLVSVGVSWEHSWIPNTGESIEPVM